MRAGGQQDGNACAEGYADDAKIMTTSRVYSGHSKIRDFAEACFSEFARPNVSVEMQSMTPEGDTAIIVFAADTAEFVYDLGVETFLMSEEKIVTQTYVHDGSLK